MTEMCYDGFDLSLWNREQVTLLGQYQDMNRVTSSPIYLMTERLQSTEKDDTSISVAMCSRTSTKESFRTRKVSLNRSATNGSPCTSVIKANELQTAFANVTDVSIRKHIASRFLARMSNDSLVI